MKIGDKIVLKEYLTFHFDYKKGDIFTIIGNEGFRGWNIQHDKSGRIIYEIAFISDKFRELSSKELRLKKLKKLLNL